MPDPLVRALGLVKLAAARVNARQGDLTKGISKALQQAAREVEGDAPAALDAATLIQGRSQCCQIPINAPGRPGHSRRLQMIPNPILGPWFGSMKD